MIRFFRSIRKTLLFQDKTIRYFQYAIGEIVLVVIGILIALQINNWNEARKLTNKTRAVMTEILDDLAYTIRISDDAINVYERKDSLLENVLSGHVTADDYLNKREYRRLLFMGFNMDVTRNGFEKLIAMSGDLKNENDSLISQLALHYGYTSDILLETKEVTKDISRQINLRYSNTYPWFATYNNDPDDAYIDYCMNDPLYRNEITLTQGITNSYLIRLYYYRNSAIRMYYAVHDALASEEPIPDDFAYLRPAEPGELDNIIGRYRHQDDIVVVTESDIVDNSGRNLFLKVVGQDLEYEDMRGRRLIFSRDENNEINQLLIRKNGVEIGRWIRE
ncbi:MAG: DUF6090 family protein [Cyclobacteriaceae bacterium]